MSASSPFYDQSDSVAHIWGGHRKLEVKLGSASRLVAKDLGGTSDPYALVYIDWKNSDEPSSFADEGVRKSKVIHKTCNPEWNETFIFTLHDVTAPGAAEPSENHLYIRLFDHNDVLKDTYLGEVRIPLLGINHTVTHAELPITAEGKHQKEKVTGTLHVELVPFTGEPFITIQTLTGRLIRIPVSVEDTVAQLKEKLNDTEGIPITCMHLVRPTPALSGLIHAFTQGIGGSKTAKKLNELATQQRKQRGFRDETRTLRSYKVEFDDTLVVVQTL